MGSYYAERFDAVTAPADALRESLLDQRAITDLTRAQRGAVAAQARLLASVATAYADVLDQVNLVAID